MEINGKQTNARRSGCARRAGRTHQPAAGRRTFPSAPAHGRRVCRQGAHEPAASLLDYPRPPARTFADRARMSLRPGEERSSARNISSPREASKTGASRRMSAYAPKALRNLRPSLARGGFGVRLRGRARRRFRIRKKIPALFGNIPGQIHSPRNLRAGSRAESIHELSRRPGEIHSPRGAPEPVYEAGTPFEAISSSGSIPSSARIRCLIASRSSSWSRNHSLVASRPWPMDSLS